MQNGCFRGAQGYEPRSYACCPVERSGVRTREEFLGKKGAKGVIERKPWFQFLGKKSAILEVEKLATQLRLSSSEHVHFPRKRETRLDQGGTGCSK